MGSGHVVRTFFGLVPGLPVWHTFPTSNGVTPMIWHLCIDETGEFEFLLKKNSTSRIVGCLCDGNQIGRIRKDLKPLLGKHGAGHNHFCEIRDEKARTGLIDDLLSRLPDWTRAVVRTTGAKSFTICQQRAYSVSVGALLLGTIEPHIDQV